MSNNYQNNKVNQKSQDKPRREEAISRKGARHQCDSFASHVSVNMQPRRQDIQDKGAISRKGARHLCDSFASHVGVNMQLRSQDT